MKKKGAIEMSIGTIVIIVLSMSMLILGIILVSNIFTSSNENIDIINTNVKDKINKIFGDDDRRIVVNLANGQAEVKQGNDWGVAFGVRNIERGGSSSTQFSYSTRVTENNCGLSNEQVLDWIIAGKSEDDVLIPAGETVYRIIRVEIEESAPLCSGRFRIDVLKDGQGYASEAFDIKVV